MNVNIMKAVCECNNDVIYAVKLKSYLYNQRYMATKMRMCFVCDGKSSQTKHSKLPHTYNIDMVIKSLYI